MFGRVVFRTSFALTTHSNTGYALGNPRCFRGSTPPPPASRRGLSNFRSSPNTISQSMQHALSLADAPGPSIYSPLDVNNEEIRLLLLSPCSGNDMIRGDLRNVSLNDDLKYSALSYTWLEPIRRSASLWTLRGIYQCFREWYWANFRPKFVTIQLNGTYIKVSRNLASALLHLRRQGKPLHIWVDAICINQQNAHEKETQVGMMGRIYEQAQQTYVWLGPCADDSDAAMDFISCASFLRIDDPALALKNIAPSSALQALFARAWWSRIWIIQEVLLSREVIVKCGDKEIDFQQFIDLALKESAMDTYGVHTDALWTWVPKMPFFDIFLTLRHLQDRVARDSVPLSFWMGLTASFNSTLPRDKIYALLKLCRASDRKSIKVDYSDSERQVFKGITMYFLRNEGNLKVLRRGQIEHKSLDLPSWVPDYSVDPNRPVPLQDHHVDGGHANWKRLTPIKAVDRYVSSRKCCPLSYIL
jgi:hypothetical protein